MKEKQKSLIDQLQVVYKKKNSSDKSDKIVYTQLGPGTLNIPTPRQIEEYINNQERDTGVEPVFPPWEGDVEPLN